MDKNKFFGLVIIGIIALGAVFYAVWIIFFNKGQVIVEGVPPFNVSFSGSSYTCLEQQCLYKLNAREYSYTISKEGYFDQAGYVDVVRGKSVIISYEEVFEAKPLTGVDYPMLSLPVGYSKFEERLMDISLFHLLQDGYQLSRMPKKNNDIIFSPSGGGAILFEDGAVSYYDTESFEINEIEVLKDAYSIAWNADENAVYSIIFDEASKKDALVRFNLEDESLEKDVYFLRNVDEYSLSVSPDERYIILVDTTSNINTLYVVDREEKTRTNVFEGYAVQEGKWSRDGNYYIFSGKADEAAVPALRLVSSRNENVESLSFNVLPRLISSAPDGKFYFVSTDEYSLSGLVRPYFSSFGGQDDTVMVDDLIAPSVISMHMFDVNERQTVLILELSNAIPEVPEKIEVNENGGIVRLLVEDQYFDVKVGE